MISNLDASYKVINKIPVVNDINNVKKYKVVTNAGENADIYYPLLPSNRNAFDTNSGNNYLIKNVVITVDPSKIAANNTEPLCKVLLGIYSNVATDTDTKESKIIIQGFMPDGPCYRNKQLKIGDLLISINDFYVNINNIEVLLSAIKERKHIKLCVQSPIKYLSISTAIDEFSYNSQAVTALSRSTSIVQGDRIKENQIIYDIPHAAMILTLENTDEDTGHKVDLVYKYPRTNDLFLTIRGIFITLVHTINSIEKAEPRSCTIQHNNKDYYVTFILQNAYILTLVAPKEHININIFKCMTKWLGDVIDFSYGGLKSCFKYKNSRKNLDNLFSPFFQRLLLKNDLLNMKSIRYSDEFKFRIFDAVPWLELPNTMKAKIDTKLSAFEAHLFSDTDGVFFKDRRQYNVLGCCLFYRTYLVATHLSKQQTLNIYKYCDNYGLFILSSNDAANQFYKWKQVFMPENDLGNHLKHYVMIVGHREFLLSILVEFGGISRQIFQNVTNILPDPFLLEQAKNVLNGINEAGIMRDLFGWYVKGTQPHIVSVERILAQIKDKSQLNAKAQTKSQVTQEIKEHKKQNEKFHKTIAESYVKSLVQQSPFDVLTAIDSASSESICVYQNFTDASLQNNVFHYIYSEENSNGIIISPTKEDVDVVYSPLYSKLMECFTKTCVKIKKLFELQKSSAYPEFHNTNIIEHGVLFCLPVNQTKPRSSSQPKDAAKNDKRSKSNEREKEKQESPQNQLWFWVVGRRMQKPYKRDFFICFHDSVDKIVQEIAFDIGFARFPA